MLMTAVAPFSGPQSSKMMAIIEVNETNSAAALVQLRGLCSLCDHLAKVERVAVAYAFLSQATLALCRLYHL